MVSEPWHPPWSFFFAAPLWVLVELVFFFHFLWLSYHFLSLQTLFTAISPNSCTFSRNSFCLHRFLDNSSLRFALCHHHLLHHRRPMSASSNRCSNRSFRSILSLPSFKLESRFQINECGSHSRTWLAFFDEVCVFGSSLSDLVCLCQISLVFFADPSSLQRSGSFMDLIVSFPTMVHPICFISIFRWSLGSWRGSLSVFCRHRGSSPSHPDGSATACSRAWCSVLVHQFCEFVFPSVHVLRAYLVISWLCVLRQDRFCLVVTR